MKTCTKCCKSKDLNSFSFRDKERGLRHAACKECVYAHQKAAYHREGSPEKKLRRQRNAKWIRNESTSLKEFKYGKSCMDCGESYPHYVLDFDHRDPSTKEFTIAQAVGNVSRQRLLDEIAKCDIVCANCHRERTFGCAGKA